MSLPLEGIRVLELAQIYAGPYCTLQLAHFGATVIKVEPPGEGEFLRKRPPNPGGVNSGWLMLNVGKQSLSLNLKDEEARAILMRLLEDADVLVENYAAGALEGLGLGYGDLAPRFPRLIYASCKGYGSDSRWARLGAMDFTVQAASGIISMTGYPDRPGVRATAALIDTSAGMHLAAGVIAALFDRVRTGRGRKVEVAMLDVTVPAVGGAIAAAADGIMLPRLANRHPSACPSNTYAAADGDILIYCLTEDHWKRLARVMDRASLLEEPRYRDHRSRYQIIDEVDAIVTAWSRNFTRDQLVDLLITHGVPCAPVRTIDEVAADPELEARGLIRDSSFPGRQRALALGSVIKFSDGQGNAADEWLGNAPELGQHNDEILAELGISVAERVRLRASGVI
jgi:CoA:oxalate CoA-transferase